MIFKDPWVLLFIPLLISAAYLFKKKAVPASLRFSAQELVKGRQPSLKVALSGRLVYLRLSAVILFLLALARPRLPQEETKMETEGIDIVLTIDASGSMQAEDFTIGGRRVNRLEVVKRAVEDFIRERESDRIGMVAFAAEAYTVCPLTLDYAWLLENLERVKIGAIADGTAVGSAISSSLNRLKETKAKSKLIVLLTDGINNTGKIAPLAAAQAAKALGIKIYTIGAGTKGPVPFPVQDFFGRRGYQNIRIEIDEQTLTKIAGLTGGKYYRATDTDSLREIYQEINALEKTPVSEKGFMEYRELFAQFLLMGLALLALEIVLSNTVLRRLP